jgi:hypothetical protein
MLDWWVCWQWYLVEGHPQPSLAVEASNALVRCLVMESYQLSAQLHPGVLWHRLEASKLGPASALLLGNPADGLVGAFLYSPVSRGSYGVVWERSDWV